MAVADRITVEVDGLYENDQSALKVRFSGKQVDIISDEERKTFKLGDDELKNAAEAYHGMRPDRVCLRSPAPWGNDVYKTHKRKETTRTLVPKSGRVLNITSQPSIVMQQVLENKSSIPTTFNVEISRVVENRLSSSWSKGGELSISQAIDYGINIGIKLGGSTTFSYTSAWGEGAEQSEAVTIGTTSSMEVLLQPGQSMMTELQAIKTTVQIEMEYIASLSGTLAVNYSQRYRGYYGWSLPLKEVMARSGIKNEVESKETIELSFYSQSKMVVYDINDVNNKGLRKKWFF